MSNWKMCSKRYPDDGCQVMIDFHNDDAVGKVGGTLTFEGVEYEVDGNWAASGSVPGRHDSAFALWGTNKKAATVYIAAAGTMIGPGSAPESIQMNLVRSSAADGEQYGWSGKLLPDNSG